MNSSRAPVAAQPRQTLRAAHPARWLALFGPGAVIASLTIGAGELIFSTRAGALFGYRLLWLFLLVLVLKWALVFSAARVIVLTGAHPFQHWMQLPGPSGWLVWIFLLLGLAAFPVWVFFHAGTLGTLISFLAGTDSSPAAVYLWGTVTLAAVLALIASGGYGRLERIQLVVVLLMLVSVLLSLAFLRPDWIAILKGFFIPEPIAYPDWITTATYPEIAARPVWIETATYVGVLGGSGYDYLAYVSYLREKEWGNAARVVGPDEITAIARDGNHPARTWLRAPLIDSSLSFLVVLIFAAVFVACGTMVLGPGHKVPSGNNLLDLQADFLGAGISWLRPLYFAGAFLAIAGTLYGTIEVAPAVLKEMAAALTARPPTHRRIRIAAVAWVGAIGLILLLDHAARAAFTPGAAPPDLVAFLTPANLFTGVLACGLICLSNLWADRRFLPAPLRMGWTLRGLNAVAAVLFLGLGIKGYWDRGGWSACVIFAATVGIGWLAAWRLKRFASPEAHRMQA